MEFEVKKPEEKWREELDPEAFEVLRNKGTERAFTSKYWDEHTSGMYRCAGCGAGLFDSDTKFESGTGWPSFTEAKEGAVVFETDKSFGMTRTEVMCAQCGGHLGHVFPDGPGPDGNRFCINSCSLDLDPRAGA